MSNSDTQVGDNRKNELNIRYVSKEQIEKNYKKFFGDEELEFTAFLFDTPEESKIVGRNEQEARTKMISAINVMSPARYEFDMKRIIEGVKIAIKRDDLDKIKRAKTRAVQKKLAKKQEEKKQSANGTTKRDNIEGR